jgi:type II restriction enzyme
MTRVSELTIMAGASQGMLRNLGEGLGFRVQTTMSGRRDSLLRFEVSDQDACGELPELALIDTVWFETGTNRIAAAFNHEHGADIFSGVVRMLDFALRLPDPLGVDCFIVAPNMRQRAIQTEFESLLFPQVSALDLRFLPYGELRKLRAADLLAREGLAMVRASSRPLHRNAVSVAFSSGLE